MQLSFSKEIFNILNKITDNLPEYKDKIYLVGGCVRDAVLDTESKDLDFSCEIDTGELVDALFNNGIGKEVKKYKSFGTGDIIVDGVKLEFTRARKEIYKENSRYPIIMPASIVEDAYRRDFTVNTLMVNIYDKEFNVLDFTKKGLIDIENKIIDTPIDANKSFYEDPLRMYRAIRFANRFDYTLSKRVFNAIINNKNRKKILSKNNILQELEKHTPKSIEQLKYFELI